MTRDPKEVLTNTTNLLLRARGEDYLKFGAFEAYLRYFKLDRATLAKAINCSKSVFSNFRKDGKLSKIVERSILLCFLLEFHKPGSIQLLANSEFNPIDFLSVEQVILDS